MRKTIAKLAILTFSLLTIFQSLSAGAFAAENKVPKNVLIFHAQDQFLPANIVIDKTIYSALKGSDTLDVTIYSEFLEMVRFGSEKVQDAVFALINDKYANVKMDLIMVTDDTAYDFITAFGQSIFPDVNVVLCGITDGKISLKGLNERTTGNFKKVDISANIDSILGVLPNTKEINVVLGTSIQDKYYEKLAREAFAAYTDKVKANYIVGLSIKKTQEAISSLPQNSAILYVSMYIDGDGVGFNPRDVVPLLKMTANRPIFGGSETYIGYGIIGGNLLSFEKLSKNASEIAIKVLNGTKPSDIPATVVANDNYFDFTELQRWNISEDVLPKDCIVINKPITLWDTYKWQIIIAIGFLIFELLLIIFLIIQLLQKRRAEKGIIKLNNRMHNILEATNVGTWEWNVQTGETIFNERWAEMIGYSLDEISPTSIDTWEKYTHPDDCASAKALIEKLFIKEIDYYNYELRMKHKDGRWVWMLDRGKVMKWTDDEKPLTMFGTHTDITVSKIQEYENTESKEKYNAIFNQSPIAIEFFNSEGLLIDANEACIELFGIINPKEIKGIKLFEDLNLVDELKQQLQNNESVQYERVFSFEDIKKVDHYKTTKSGTIDVSTTIFPLMNGQNLDGYVVQIQDISEEKQAKQRIEFLSYYDQLTGLHNRRSYELELERLNDENVIPMTLVMVDVNGLKLTNDAFGHKAGDVLLMKIASILKNECRRRDFVARIGGDEFVLLLPGTDSTCASKIIDRINSAIENEESNEIVLSASIGFAVKEDADEDINEVFKQAEDDMYRHKLSESYSMRSKTIDLIVNTLYEKNSREMHHSKNVSRLCEEIATKMDFHKNEVDRITIAGLMHDIGKIGIADAILNKPEPLTHDEWNEIKRHSEIGYRILSAVNEFSEIADYILEHHERWDGTGYPKGLKGDEISLQARIIAIADSYEAMTNDRPYRKGLNKAEAVEEIKNNAGAQFDKDIARIFVEKVLEEKW